MQEIRKQITKNGVTYTRVMQVWANGGRIFSVSKQENKKEK